MKKGAIARLIIWSIVALVLTVTLIIGMIANGRLDMISDSDGWFFGISGETYADADEYTAYSGPVDLSEGIDRINIDWISGTVDISVYEGDSVKIEENFSEDEDLRMRYRVKSGTLDIQFRKSGLRFGFGRYSKKELTVKIPAEIAKNMRAISIDTTSAEISLSGLTLSEGLNIDTVSGGLTLSDTISPSLDYSSVSGNISALGVDIDEISGDSVSGSLTADGSIKVFEGDTTSGNIKITSAIPLNSVENDSISGDVTLILPENDGFTAEFDSVSGKFNCDFETSLDDDEYIYKNGAAKYQFDSVSGDVNIIKN